MFLIIMSRKCFFDFRSSQLPFDIRFWTRGFPWKCDLRRQASPLQLELGSGSSAFRGTYREWIGPKISKSKFLKYFLETTFLYVSCYLDHYEPKIFFRFSSKYFVQTESFHSRNIFKVFLQTTFVHVSCYPDDHYEPKIYFRFSKSATTLRYIRFWNQGFPLEMRSQQAGLPFATRARRRELSIFILKFFWKVLLFMFYA